MKRCAWLSKDPIYIEYHDQEWGMEKSKDQDFFEQLCLEGAQAGLSWITILKKRDHYRKLFFHFDIATCATLSDEYLEECLQDKGIVRNRLKVYSVRKNAVCALNLIEEFGSLKQYFWQWIDHSPVKNHFSNIEDIPSSTELSAKISKDLKNRGFSFTGSTIIYAFMQAVGMTIDHTTDCYLYRI
ncbi:DNA-3-methyladenine glycosylase I [Akkermansiaceae bacterium]|nr:DNA-3-methyladenine glycosylase I [Akkermansiaceae bacterium]